MAAILLLGLLSMAGPEANQPPEPQREMCDEVAHELNSAYTEGYVSREEADRIIKRCYFLFDK